MKTDIKKKLQKAGSTVESTAVKAAKSVKSTTTDIAENIKKKSLSSKLQKLNPLFPEEYFSESFHIPNLIVIVDDAVRREEKLCEGAIGWRSSAKEVEILYMYDEFVPESKINFVPTKQCDAAYYVNPHDRSSFIRIDCLFDWTQQEKLAELANIAFCLGAKRYSVSFYEQTSKKASASTKTSSNASSEKAGVSSSYEAETSSSEGAQSASLAKVEYSEARDPVEPELCWFKNDKYITELIKQRCERKETINSIDIKLSGADYSTMSATASVKVDAAVCKLGLSGNRSVAARSEEERSHKMLFHLEF